MGQVYYRSLGGKDPKVLRAIFLCHGGKLIDSDLYVNSDKAKEYLFRSFGIEYKNGKIPTEAEGLFQVEGFSFKLTRNVPVDRSGPMPYRREGRAHRLFIDCPACECQKWIPVGRFWQHAIIHNKAPGANTFPPSTIPEDEEF